MADKPPPGKTRLERIREIANTVANDKDADILFINAAMDGQLDWDIVLEGAKRNPRPNLVLILVTEGGQADVAYRCMRLLHSRYPGNITAVVPGWCKSAGTLMCIGATDIQMAELGELGPLDVQLSRPDQMNEMTSGLAIDTAVEKLQHEAFKLFMGFITEMGESDIRFSLKTASTLAKDISVGLFAPIFAKLDPISIGEDFRSYKIAEAYAERLHLRGKNLRRDRKVDGLKALLESYPSHGFVIDVDEARSIFIRVKRVEPNVGQLIGAVGAEAIVPMDREKNIRKVEFLNDPKPEEPEEGAGSGDDAGDSDRRPQGSDAPGPVSEKLRRNTTTRPRAVKKVSAKESRPRK
jgi:hypothetical protein